MSDQPGQDRTRPGGRNAAESWERRAQGLAGEVQRWLIRASARNMRDELGDQVKRAIRGSEPRSGDVWAAATTEPPPSANEAPECAWCPVCRAARRVSQARAAGGEARGAAALADVSEALSGAVRDVLAGLDSVLSYRPGDAGPARSGATRPDSDRAGEPDHEPGDRG